MEDEDWGVSVYSELPREQPPHQAGVTLACEGDAGGHLRSQDNPLQSWAPSEVPAQGSVGQPSARQTGRAPVAVASPFLSIPQPRAQLSRGCQGHRHPEANKSNHGEEGIEPGWDFCPRSPPPSP